MTDDLRSLANDAVATPGWRWVPGMLSNHDARYLGAGLWIDASSAGAVYADPNQGEVPDLTDAATGGCMLALLGLCCVTVYRDSVVVAAGDFVVLRAATLAEACARLARARGYWTKD